MAQWKVAEAKEQFSSVLRKAEGEPQEILNRENLVAAVIDAESYRVFQAWRQGQASLSETFAELRRLCAEEGYTLPVARRRNRPNALARALAASAR